jgi:glutamate 5-kinase
MIATNTDGVYTKESIENKKPETIATVSGVQKLQKEISASKSSHGTGGMQSKIEAGIIAQTAGIETWIVNGLKDNFITDAITGISNYTKIK